jgi:hypothetical protein
MVQKNVVTDPVGTLGGTARSHSKMTDVRKALDLPARGRFGEGRAGAFECETLRSVALSAGNLQDISSVLQKETCVEQEVFWTWQLNGMMRLKL